MKEANDIQSGMIKEIIRILDGEESNDPVVKIYFELNLEYDYISNRLFVKKYTKSFVTLGGDLRRIPYHQEVFHVHEIKKDAVICRHLNDQLLHKVFNLLKEYHIEREQKRNGAFISENK